MAFGLGGLLGGGAVPDVQMPDGLPVAGGKGSPLVDAFLALQAQRLQDAVTAPQRALSGDLQIWDPATGHTTDEAQGAASGMAGLAMTGSMPFKAPAGAIRSFGGAAAHDDPLAALEAGITDFAKTATPDRPHTFVDPAAASWDLYHGTSAPEDFNKFRVDLPWERGKTNSAPGEAGALFLSPAPAEAAYYAGDVAGRNGYTGPAGPRVIRTTVDPGKTDIFDLPQMVLNDPDFVARARKSYLADNGDSFLNRDMFDHHIGRIRDGVREHADLQQQVREMGYPEQPATVPYAYGITSAAVQMAKERGLDTAVIRGLNESNGGDQIIALTPGRVRSYYDPDHVLYSGGPAGALAGAPALASSSDPKGQTVSADPAPAVPSMLDGLSPEMVARLLQAAQAQPAPGSPSPVDGLLFDRAGMGAPDNGFSGSSGSIVGAQPQQVAQAPAPQTTGTLPQPAPAPQDAEDAPAAPAARAVPLPPARPQQFTSLADAAAAPANSFDPLTGQPVSGSPKQIGAPTAAQAAPAGQDDHSFLKAWQALGNSGLGDQLLAMSAGFLNGGFGKAAENLLSVSQAQGKGDAERAKLAREQATVAGNAAIYRKYFPNATPEEAMAGGANSAIMTELMKRGLPATETYKQETDGDGNVWQVNSANNQRSLLKGASDEKWNQVGLPGGGTMLYNRADPKKTQVLVPGEPTRPATEQEMRDYGITPGVSVKMTKDGPVAIGGGNTNVNVDLGKKAAGEADAQILKKIDTSYDKAQGAIDTLGAIGRQKQALDQGIIAGWGSDFRTNAQAMAEQLLGITPDEKLDPTYTFEAASKQKGAALAKAISQSGHTTNMDLNLGNSIAGGDRDKTEKALRQIIDAQELLAKDTITRHNSGVDKYVGNNADMKDRMSWYHVDAPDVYQYGQGKPNPVADPGSAPAPVSKTVGGKTYMRGPDGHWYVGAQ